MAIKNKQIKHFKLLLFVIFTAIAIPLAYGYITSTIAQNTTPKISLNSPVSFPVDI